MNILINHISIGRARCLFSRGGCLWAGACVPGRAVWVPVAGSVAEVPAGHSGVSRRSAPRYTALALKAYQEAYIADRTKP